MGGETSRLFGLVAFSWFNFGPFGVAVFFLISGLVIPISLRQHSRRTFLVARLLRIYPTFMAALAVSLLVVWANARWWGLPFPAGPRTVLGNMLLIQNILGEPDVTLVSWTLAIELKFYLVMMLVRPAILSGSVSALFMVGFAALAGNLAATSPALAPWIAAVPQVENVIYWESSGLVFMLIGVLFNYRLRGLVSLAHALAAGAGLTALFVAVWCTGAFADQYPVVTVNYLYALALFGALFALRGRVPRIPLLDALAAISFPLYLVHSLVGYSALKALTMGAGLSYRAALPVTLILVLAVAALLHVSVERPTIALGKRLSRAGSPGGGPAADARPLTRDRYRGPASRERRARAITSSGLGGLAGWNVRQSGVSTLRGRSDPSVAKKNSPRTSLPMSSARPPLADTISRAAAIVLGELCRPKTCVVQFDTIWLWMPFGTWVATTRPRPYLRAWAASLTPLPRLATSLPEGRKICASSMT